MVVLFSFVQLQIYLICLFKSNEAILNKPLDPDKKNIYYGGSAMFIMSQNILVANCSFKLNIGSSGAVKINSIKNVDNSKLIQLEENENSFTFIGCSFEQHKKSKNSIFYVDSKYKNRFEVIDCDFKGKLTKKSHYIDGKMYNKENININSCNFESEKNDEVYINLIDDGENQIYTDFGIENGYLLMIFAGIGISFVTFIFIVLKLIRIKSIDTR